MTTRPQSPAVWSLPARQALLPEELRPDRRYPSQRLGPAGDGGYQVADGVLGHIDWIVSLGLGDDWRFDEALQRTTGAGLVVFDATVDEAFWAVRTFRQQARRLRRGSKQRTSTVNEQTGYFRYRRFFGDASREHRRVNVGYPQPGWVTLAEVLAERPDARIFMKCDIEGWEWRILDDIVATRHRFSGLCMEFHDVDLLLPRLLGFHRRMPEFTVIDVVANNFGAVAPDGTPQVVEVAMARTALLGPPDSQTRPQTAEPNSRLNTRIELTFDREGA